MIKGPLNFREQNLSLAWARAFLALMEDGVEEIQPLVVSVAGLDQKAPVEVVSIRRELDAWLGRYSSGANCETVASTIFPSSLWNPKRARTELFQRYIRILPRLRKYPQNRLGLYFERFVAFGGDTRNGNQLEHIISTFLRGNHRRSALQAVVFDPVHDHSHKRRQGFPCLHQIAFVPQDHGGLAVTAFYATQYLFDKAYGNYLGLWRLGRFMAQEMGLRLTEMNCLAAVAVRGGPSKRQLVGLAKHLEKSLQAEASLLLRAPA